MAVIGTGATGVQAIQEIAKTAGHLTVFQRRPNWCTPLHNRPITREEMDEIRRGYPALFKRCQETAACFVHTIDPRGTFEVDEAERRAFWEKLYASPGFGIWQGNFRDMLIDREANRLMSEFVADKIRQRVKDPKVAEMLIPKDHGFGTRRVPQETHYYEVYNQPNVELISILDTPIERITPKGLRTDRAGVRVRHHRLRHRLRRHHRQLRPRRYPRARRATLRDRWRGGLSTYLGVMVDGFPNMFMVMGPHTALGNIPRSIEYNVEWIRDLLGYMDTRGLTMVEPRPEAVDEWTGFVKKKGEGLLSNEVDSWMTGVNQNVEGKQVRIIARYSGTAPEYRAWCDRVAADGYRELRLA